MEQLENLKKYEEGYQLAENEYLLKIHEETGFLTKFNKNGSIPVAFDNWRSENKWNPKASKPKLPIYVFGETYRYGWKIRSCRFVMSQNWETMVHPAGFTVELYLQHLLQLIQKITIINCELIGEFKWENHELIRK